MSVWNLSVTSGKWYGAVLHCFVCYACSIHPSTHSDCYKDVWSYSLPSLPCTNLWQKLFTFLSCVTHPIGTLAYACEYHLNVFWLWCWCGSAASGKCTSIVGTPRIVWRNKNGKFHRPFDRRLKRLGWLPMEWLIIWHIFVEMSLICKPKIFSFRGVIVVIWIWVAS